MKELLSIQSDDTSRDEIRARLTQLIVQRLASLESVANQHAADTAKEMQVEADMAAVTQGDSPAI